MQETWVRSLGWEDPLEKGMATHSSILAWRIPWTGEPGGLQSMGSQRVKHNWATNTETHVFCPPQRQRQADERLWRPEGVGGVQAHFSQRLWGTGPGTSSDPRSLQILEAALRECLRVGDGERKVGAWIQGSHHPLIGTTCQTYCPIGPGCWLGRWLPSHRPSSPLLVPTHGFFWHVWEQLLGREKTFRNTLVFKSQFFTELLNAIYKSYSMNRSSQF